MATWMTCLTPETPRPRSAPGDSARNFSIASRISSVCSDAIVSNPMSTTTTEPTTTVQAAIVTWGGRSGVDAGTGPLDHAAGRHTPLTRILASAGRGQAGFGRTCGSVVLGSTRISSSTCSDRAETADGRQAPVGDDDGGLVQLGHRAEPDDPPLGGVGQDDQPPRAADHGPVGLGLEEVGGAEAGVDVHAVHAHEHRVQVQRPQRGDGDRPDQGVRGGPQAAGEQHVERLRAGAVQHVGHPDRVGDHGQARDVDQVPGEEVGRRPGGDGDRRARRDQPGGTHRDRLLLGEPAPGLGLEARARRWTARHRAPRRRGPCAASPAAPAR